MSSSEVAAAPSTVRFGPFRLDRAERLLFREGAVVPLTPKAFEMLDLLVRNAGRVVDKEELLRGVWPDTFVDEANLSHHVFVLRKALGDDREGTKYIETVPRRGYRFVPVPEAATDEEVTLQQAPASVITPRRSRGALFAAIAAALVFLAIGILLGWKLLPRDAAQRTMRFAIAPPPGGTFPQAPATMDLAISPDGRTLAFISMEGHRRKLYVRDLDQTAALAIDGTDEAAAPFWSPDGNWIGFFASGVMKKVPARGGPTQTICVARGGMATWNRSGQILYFDWGLNANENAKLVSAEGGPVRDLQVSYVWWPSFLPDGKHFIYYSLVTGDARGLYVGSVDGGRPQRVSTVYSRGEVRGDQLYYVRDSVLVRQTLNLRTFVLEGESVPIATPAFGFSPTGAANFSVSADGSAIAFQRRSLPTQLVWRDWNGRELGRVGQPELFRRFTISPDGRRLAADLMDPVTQSSSIWMVDLDRGVRTRVTAESPYAAAPQWTHRGDALLISIGDPSAPSSAPAISLLQLDDGSVKRLRPPGSIKYATSVTADDRELLFTSDHARSTYIYVASISNPGPATLWEGSDAYDASDAVLSPDGRWLAYQSSESGRPEIYVRSFRGRGEKLRVSAAGGTEPQWTLDGRAVLFVSSGMLTKADLTGGDHPQVSSETFLFPINSAGMMEQSLGQSHYAVAADRILVREIPGGEDRDPIQVIVRR